LYRLAHYRKVNVHLSIAHEKNNCVAAEEIELLTEWF